MAPSEIDLGITSQCDSGCFNPNQRRLLRWYVFDVEYVLVPELRVIIEGPVKVQPPAARAIAITQQAGELNCSRRRLYRIWPQSANVVVLLSTCRFPSRL